MNSSNKEDASGIVLYGKPECVDFKLVQDVLTRENVEFEFINILAGNWADEARAISGSEKSPVVVFPDGSFQIEPNEAELRSKLESM